MRHAGNDAARGARELTGEVVLGEAGGSDASSRALDEAEVVGIFQVVGDKYTPFTRGLLHTCDTQQNHQPVLFPIRDSFLCV